VAVPEGYDRGAAGGPGDNSATAMKSVVVDPAAYDWEGDAPLRRPKAWRFTLHSSNDCNQVGRPQSVASTSSGTVRPAIVICSGSVGRVELQCGMDLLHREGAPGVIDAKQRGHRHPLPCGNLESLYRDACAGRRGERCVAICFRRLPFTKRTRR
jgi:hypothetical protein